MKIGTENTTDNHESRFSNVMAEIFTSACFITFNQSLPQLLLLLLLLLLMLQWRLCSRRNAILIDLKMIYLCANQNGPV